MRKKTIIGLCAAIFALLLLVAVIAGSLSVSLPFAEALKMALGVK